MTASTPAATNEASFKYVSPDVLRFDATNPRLAGVETGYGQDAIQAVLEREPHFALELVPSMLENGFIDYEPLVVRREEDHYVVVEGNRRLAAIRHIRKNSYELAKKSKRIDDLNSIPVLIFARAGGSQISQEQRVYLGVKHLFGFREWPPESKARYLDAQIKSETDLDQVARELNMKRSDIQRYLTPFRLRKAAKELWKPYSDQDFWVLGEGLSRAGIKAYIELDVNNKTLAVKSFSRSKLTHLLRFIYGSAAKSRGDRVVRETRHLSALAKTLQNKKAAMLLEKGGSLAEASLLLDSPDESRQRLKEVLGECKTLLARYKSQSDAKEMLSAFRGFEKAASGFLKHAR